MRNGQNYRTLPQLLDPRESGAELVPPDFGDTMRVHNRKLMIGRGGLKDR